MVSIECNQDKSLQGSINYFQSSVMRCSFVWSKGSSSFDRKGKCKERKKRVMVVSFNWQSYSVVFSFLRKGARDARVQKMQRSGQDRSMSEDGFFEAADRVKKELVSGIHALAIKKPEKRELLLYLRQLLNLHTELRVPQAYAFRIAINNVIERNAEEYCSIHLTRQDLSTLWKDVG